MPSSAPSRDHLFISYAYEDEALAEWLALRLTSVGYKVWIDRFELLGGESYPADIDQAIKTRAFRMLALLSRSSLHKANPTKERTLALNIQRQRQEEFLIPLNVDNLRSDELDWMTSDLTFIPFWNSWATGLVQLQDKLRKVSAPKDVVDGKRIASQAYLTDDTLLDDPEQVYTNICRIVRAPAAVSCYTVDEALSRPIEQDLASEWAFWPLKSRTHDTLYFSFDDPPHASKSYNWTRVHTASWRDVDEIYGIWTSRIMKPLLRRAILYELRRRGLLPISDDPETLFFPSGLLPKNRLAFQRADGRSAYRQVVGTRMWRRTHQFVYHQAVTIDVRTDVIGEFVAQFRARLHITGPDGRTLPNKAANARRKAVTRSWYNDEWLARHLALMAFLGAGASATVARIAGSVELSSSLVRLTAPVRIDEEAIRTRAARVNRSGSGVSER